MPFDRKFMGRGLSLLLASALVLSTLDARAEDPTKAGCIAANEAAQTLRDTGKLQAARAQLLICVAQSCPGVVRADCAEQLAAVDKAMPSIVFAVKDAAGNDLSAVTVTMDGNPFAERLDGSAVNVDPGVHVFEFSAEGHEKISKKFVIGAGASGRREALTFAPPAVVTTPPPLSIEPEHKSSVGAEQRLLGYGLGGLGIVGLGIGAYLGLHANSTYSDALSHCPAGPSSCDAAGVQGGDDAHKGATISTIAVIAGSALVVGGVVLFLTAPKGGAKSQSTGGGMRLDGSWAF